MKNYKTLIKHNVMNNVGATLILCFGGVLQGCQYSEPSQSSSQMETEQQFVSSGSLELTFSERNSRLLEPDVSLEVDRYRITGFGPDGEQFEFTVGDGNRLHLDALNIGEWNILVESLNEDGYLFARGSKHVDIELAEVTQANVILSTIEDTGSFSLTVDVPDSSDPASSISGILVSDFSSDIPVTLDYVETVIDFHRYAVVMSDSIPSGYYTFILRANKIVQGQATDAFLGLADGVRILAGQTTSGSFELTDIESEFSGGFKGGAALDLEMRLDNGLNTYIENLSDLPSSYYLNSAEPTIVHANVMDSMLEDDDIQYKWYLNGELSATGSEFKIDTQLYAPMPKSVTSYRFTNNWAYESVFSDPNSIIFGQQVSIDPLNGTGEKTITLHMVEAASTRIQKIKNVLSEVQFRLDEAFGSGQFIATTEPEVLSSPLSGSVKFKLKRTGWDAVNGIGFSMAGANAAWNALFGPTSYASMSSGQPGSDTIIGANPFDADWNQVEGTHSIAQTESSPPLNLTDFVAGSPAQIIGTAPGPFDLSGANSLTFQIQHTDNTNTTNTYPVTINNTTGAVPAATTLAEIQAAISENLGADGTATQPPLTITGASAYANGGTIAIIPTVETGITLTQIGFPESNRSNTGVADTRPNNLFSIQVVGPTSDEDSAVWNVTIPDIHYGSHLELAEAIQNEIENFTGPTGIAERVKVTAKGNRIHFKCTEAGSAYQVVLGPHTTYLPSADAQYAFEALGFNNMLTQLGLDGYEKIIQYHPGRYRLDVIASNINNTRVGSASYAFDVVQEETSASISQVTDFTEINSSTSPTWNGNHFTVLGSGDLHFQTDGGLGVTGGESDQNIDSNETLTIEFSQLVDNVSYVVSVAGSTNGGDAGQSIVTLFGESETKSITVQGAGTIDLSSLYSNPILKVEITAVEPIRISELEYQLQ